jgi:hypothetical protein
MNSLFLDNNDISHNVFFFINQPNNNIIIDNMLNNKKQENISEINCDTEAKEKIYNNQNKNKKQENIPETKDNDFTKLYDDFYESIRIIEDNLIIETKKRRKKSFILPTPR